MCSITLTLLDLSHAALWEEELLDGLLVCPLALVVALVPCVWLVAAHGRASAACAVAVLVCQAQ